jgi:ATP-dependent Clp protease ATP-binding subunit ClpC
VIGRTDEIERMMEVLSRRTKNNPILIGRAGRRQDGDCRGSGAEDHQRDVPEILQNKRLLSLDLAAIVAGRSIAASSKNG